MILVEDGNDPPAQLIDKPELTEVEIFYWGAFQHLTTDRSFGMGAGPIPYSAIRTYADEHEILSRDEFDFFLGVIHGMDSEYLSIVNKPKDETGMIPITDVVGQHEMFARMKARANTKKR